MFDLSKTVMYEFLYDYAKLKYVEKTRLCYMDRDSIIIHVKMLKQDLAVEILN